MDFSKPSFESVNNGYKRKEVGGGKMGQTCWWKTCWLMRWQKSTNVLTSLCPRVDYAFDGLLIFEQYCTDLNYSDIKTGNK